MRRLRALRRVGIGLCCACVLCAGVLGAWAFVYPDPHDPKGPRYVLWKWHCFPFDADVVYRSMVGDPDRDALVVGLTVAQIECRFGPLRTGANCTEYQRHYVERDLSDCQFRWLGDSPWAVVLENGRATDLRLMKG